MKYEEIDVGLSIAHGIDSWEDYFDEMPDVITEEYDGIQTNGCQDIYYL